ncbi:MAG TPA: hypothetical protein VIP57_18055 [Candidatus Dormibacteraeota bacterium]
MYRVDRILQRPVGRSHLEDLIAGLDEPAGATMALAKAQGAITLFI